MTSDNSEVKVEVAKAPSILRRCASQIKKTADELLSFAVYLSFSKSWVGLGWVFLKALTTCWYPLYWFLKGLFVGGMRSVRSNIKFLPWIVCGFVIVEKIYDLGLTDVQRGEIQALARRSRSGFESYLFAYAPYPRRGWHANESYGWEDYPPSNVWFTGTLGRRIFDQIMLGMVMICGTDRPAQSPFCQAWIDLAADCEHGCDRSTYSSRNKDLKTVHHIVWWIAQVVTMSLYYALFYSLSSTVQHAWAMRNVRTVEEFTKEGYTFATFEPEPFLLRAGPGTSAHKQYYKVKGHNILIPMGGPTVLQVLTGSRLEEMALPTSTVERRGTINAGIITFVRKDGSVVGQAWRSGDLIFTAGHVWYRAVLEGDLEVQNCASKRATPFLASKWSVELVGRDVVALKPQKGLFEMLAVKSMKTRANPTTEIHKIEWLSQEGPLGAYGQLLTEWQDQERLHTISSLSGSSGAPITNKNDEVVGIHTSSRPSLGVNSYVEIVDLLLALGAPVATVRSEESDLPEHKRTLREENWDRQEEPTSDDDWDPDAIYTRKGKMKVRGRTAHAMEFVRDNDINRAPREFSEAALARQERAFGIGGRARTIESDFGDSPKTRGVPLGKQVGTPPPCPGKPLTTEPSNNNQPTTSKKDDDAQQTLTGLQEQVANLRTSIRILESRTQPVPVAQEPKKPDADVAIASTSVAQPSGTISPGNKKKQNGKKKQKKNKERLERE